jgi:hypothetical protein
VEVGALARALPDLEEVAQGDQVGGLGRGQQRLQDCGQGMGTSLLVLEVRSIEISFRQLRGQGKTEGREEEEKEILRSSVLESCERLAKSIGLPSGKVVYLHRWAWEGLSGTNLICPFVSKKSLRLQALEEGDQGRRQADNVLGGQEHRELASGSKLGEEVGQGRE